METNQEPPLRPSSDEARASLEVVDHVRADLADRLVTPWWYYPGVGLVEALFVSSMTFPAKWPQLLAYMVGLAALGLLVFAYRRLTGLGMSRQYLALTWRWAIALGTVIAMAFVVVLTVDEPAVTAVTAVFLLVATVILGRSSDNALRNQLRLGTGTR